VCVILALVLTEWVFQNTSFNAVTIGAIALLWCIPALYLLAPAALILLLVPASRKALGWINLSLFIVSTVILAVFVEMSKLTDAAMRV
jgi:hypothetical protein